MRRGWLILAAALVLLGALLCFGYSPMRFTGFLLFCAAAAALAWGFLTARREKKPFRILRRIFALLLAAGLAFFAVLEVKVVSYGRTDWESDVSAVVILGAGVNGTTPSLSLQVRLAAALEYIQDKPDIPIVVTGSQGPGEDISEAACMAQWLTARGVDQGRIHLDEKANNTEENIRYSMEILQEQGIDITGNIAVVSADYHLYRASLYWSTTGMVPVAAHMPGRFWPLTVNYYIREAFAAAKLLVFR